PLTNDGFKLRPGDVEVPYTELEKVQIVKNRLVLYSKRGITKLGLSRGHSTKLAPYLRTLLQEKFVNDDSFHAPDTSSKKDEYRNQPCRHCSQLSRSNGPIGLDICHSAPVEFKIESKSHEYHTRKTGCDGKNPNAPPEQGFTRHTSLTT